MEADVIMQQDDEAIRIESDQFMEYWNEPDFEQVPNQETSAPIKHVGNLLSTSIKPIQPKPIEPTQPKLVYIFPKTLIIYVQHERLKTCYTFLWTSNL
jgi:hypothetical protein